MKNFMPLFAVFLLASSCAKKYTASASAGKSTMVGEDSWSDPLGVQVTIETKFAEVNSRSSFTAGIGYSMQGSAYKEDEFSGKVTANYLIAPILYSYNNKNGFYAEAGLQPAILLSAKDKYEGQSYDYKDYMKTFDLGLPVGAGYNLKNGFGLGIRVIPGITKNHKEGNSRNLVALLRLSYTFDAN